MLIYWKERETNFPVPFLASSYSSLVSLFQRLSPHQHLPLQNRHCFIVSLPPLLATPSNNLFRHNDISSFLNATNTKTLLHREQCDSATITILLCCSNTAANLLHHLRITTKTPIKQPTTTSSSAKLIAYTTPPYLCSPSTFSFNSINHLQQPNHVVLHLNYDLSLFKKLTHCNPFILPPYVSISNLHTTFQHTPFNSPPLPFFITILTYSNTNKHHCLFQ